MTERESTVVYSDATGTARPQPSEPVRSSSRSVTRRCPSAQKAVRFYARRIEQHRTALGTRGDPEKGARVLSKRPNPCPRYLAHVLQRKAHGLRLFVEKWIALRTLRDFEVVPGASAWTRAVIEAQRPYPGTWEWLMSCSDSEGGHGRWVPNSQGSGVGGWLQFYPSTFWRMFSAAARDVRSRGFIVPRSASSWYSPLGQALAGAWGVSNGRRHEWHGSGC